MHVSLTVISRVVDPGDYKCDYPLNHIRGRFYGGQQLCKYRRINFVVTVSNIVYEMGG